MLHPTQGTARQKLHTCPRTRADIHSSVPPSAPPFHQHVLAPTHASPGLGTRDAETSKTLLLPFPARGGNREDREDNAIRRCSPVEWDLWQHRELGSESISVPHIPSNVTFARDCPPRASASAQGSEGDVVGATTWRAACKGSGTVPGTLQLSW